MSTLLNLYILKTGRNINYKPGIFELNNFRKNNEELIDFIIYLNYNMNLLELNDKKDINIIKELKNEIEVLKDVRDNFINSCINFLSSLAKVDKEAKNLERYDSQNLKTKKIEGKYLYEIIDKINDMINDFQQKKDIIEKKYDLPEPQGKSLLKISDLIFTKFA